MEWISVKDKLPKFGDIVLVYIDIADHILVTRYYKDFALIGNGWRNGGDFDHHISHWCLIPEKPKGK